MVDLDGQWTRISIWKQDILKNIPGARYDRSSVKARWVSEAPTVAVVVSEPRSHAEAAILKQRWRSNKDQWASDARAWQDLSVCSKDLSFLYAVVSRFGRLQVNLYGAKHRTGMERSSIEAQSSPRQSECQ